jgi:hypothetical protein
MDTPPSRFVLRDLPLVPRLVIAAFLLSVGIGYFSALVQLHFQTAKPGEPLPGAQEAVDIYHGKAGMSQLERLLVADEHKPFNGSGSMRAAFTTYSAGWTNAISRKAKDMGLKPKDAADRAKAEQALRAEREGEIRVLLEWIRGGLSKEAYAKGFPLPAKLASQPLTESYVEEKNGVKQVSIVCILEDRCIRCHQEGKKTSASQAPLDTYEDVAAYAQTEGAPRGMSLTKLAQTTHVHLLGFSMLYGLTGLIFAFTSYPALLRAVLAPLPLIAQVVDISFWWLARTDPLFAHLIPVSGAVVAAGLGVHIVATLLNLFGKGGKAVVLALLLAGAAGAGYLYVEVIGPYLAREVGTVQPDK